MVKHLLEKAFMKISPIITPLPFVINGKVSSNGKENIINTQVSFEEKKLPLVTARLAIVSFYGDKKIKPAKRLDSGDYKISRYIAEI